MPPRKVTHALTRSLRRVVLRTHRSNASLAFRPCQPWFTRFKRVFGCVWVVLWVTCMFREAPRSRSLRLFLAAKCIRTERTTCSNIWIFENGIEMFDFSAEQSNYEHIALLKQAVSAAWLRNELFSESSAIFCLLRRSVFNFLRLDFSFFSAPPFPGDWDTQWHFCDLKMMPVIANILKDFSLRMFKCI